MNNKCVKCGHSQSAVLTRCAKCRGESFIPDIGPIPALRACPYCGGAFGPATHSKELNRPIYNCVACGAGYSPATKPRNNNAQFTKTKDDRPVPMDPEQCQTERPSTWPSMPSFMTLGPVSWKRCTNKPTWVAMEGGGEMSLCDECKVVCETILKVDFRPLETTNENTGRGVS